MDLFSKVGVMFTFTGKLQLTNRHHYLSNFYLLSSKIFFCYVRTWCDNHSLFGSAFYLDALINYNYRSLLIHIDERLIFSLFYKLFLQNQ